MRSFGSPRRQQGNAALLVLCVMLALLSTTAAVSDMLIASEARGTTSERQAYLDHAKRNIANWYLGNAATIDGSADALDPSTVKSAMGEPQQWGVRVASTAQLGLPCDAPNSASCVGYHDIYLWLPPMSHADTTTLDPASGTFTADPAAQWIKVSGASLEQQLIESSTNTMELLQGQLRAFFAAGELNDASVSPGTNYFRDSQCSGTAPNMLPCVDTFTNLTETNIPTLMGIDSYNATNAWGNPLQVSNQEQSSVAQPPYSMAMRSATPWGGYLEMAVAQPN
jgi:hypothetical protein